MNTFSTIHTEYLRSSRTIEVILVSKKNSIKVFFVYNYEGTSFRLFERHLDLIHFFEDKSEGDFHFSTEKELDFFLSSVNIN